MGPRHVVAVLAPLLLVAACGSGDGTGAETSAPPGPPASTEPGAAGSGAASSSADAFPVTVGTAFGEVTIEEEPERVVALGWGDAETALQLGVQPVGASDWLAFGGEGVGPWAEGLYETPPEQLGTLEVNLEALAALQPDLILDTRSAGTQERYEQLSQIAPVVGVPEGVVAYGTTWQQQLDLVSQALGRTAEAEEVTAEVEQAFADAAQPEFEGRTVSVGAFSSEGWSGYVQGDARVEFMEELGFVNNPALDELATDTFFVPVSPERLDLLDADLTVVFPIFVEASEFTSDPVFTQVPSVAEGRSVVIDDVTLSNAFSSGTALGTVYALEQATPLFAEALAAG